MQKIGANKQAADIKIKVLALNAQIYSWVHLRLCVMCIIRKTALSVHKIDHNDHSSYNLLSSYKTVQFLSQFGKRSVRINFV